MEPGPPNNCSKNPRPCDCTAACRIYAGKKVYDRLVADLSSAVSGIALANEDDTTNEIGPLISLRQRDRVASFVNRARELSHIEVTAGGEVMDQGYYYRPTVIAGARQEDEIVRREVFGPVVSITHTQDQLHFRAAAVVHPSRRHINANCRTFQGKRGVEAEAAMVASAWRGY